MRTLRPPDHQRQRLLLAHARVRPIRIPASRRAYWLGKLQRNRQRDQRTRRQLQRAGWRVLTIWECQTRDPDRLAVRLRKFLSRKGPQ